MEGGAGGDKLAARDSHFRAKVEEKRERIFKMSSSNLGSGGGAILGERIFVHYCSVLKLPSSQLVCSDPDRKAIERAFRRAALKTHPDKVGTTIERVKSEVPK